MAPEQHRPVAITANPGNYRFVLHYADCGHYRKTVHTDLTLPYGAKITRCKVCRPSDEAILASPPAVRYDPYSNMPGVRAWDRQVRVELDEVEKRQARRSFGSGRRYLRHNEA